MTRRHLRQSSPIPSITSNAFKALFDAMHDGLLIANDEGRYLEANRAACELLGLPRNKVIGRYVKDFSDPERRDDVEKSWRQFLAEEEQHGVFRLYRPDGTTRHVDYVARANILPGQHISILRDITERNQSERTLRDQEDHLRLALEATGLGTWEYNLLTDQMKMSDSCRDMLGIPKRKTVTYSTLTARVHPDDRQEFRHAIQRCLNPKSTGDYFDRQFRFRHSDGSISWLLGRGRAYFEGQGKHRRAIRFIGTLLDISKRKQVEEELIAAKDAAETATHAKSQFLANMSHEIRTPINGILGTAELLSQTPMKAEQMEYVQILKDSSTILKNLVNDLLDFSKIEAGKLQIEMRYFDLYAAIDSAYSQFVTRLQFKDLELVTRVRPDVPRLLRGDLQRFRQVLTNIIGNAVKFTDKGQIILDITKERETSRGVNLRFSVKDTGPGISRVQQQKLFQPFVQGDSSLTREHGGTGLGLAISKQLTEAMGGRLGVRSRPGHGSTFWFSIPLQKHRQDVRREDSVPLKGLRVMVVENNHALRRAICEQLSRWDVTTRECISSQEAIREWKRASKKLPYNVLLLSKRIPEKDGRQLVKAIHELPSKSWIHVILMGPFGQEPARNAWKSLKLSAYLTKPVRYTELLHCLRKLVQTSERSSWQGDDRRGAREATTLVAPLIQKTGKGPRILLAEDNEINQIVTARQLKKLGFQTDTVSNGREVLKAMQKKQYDIIFMDCQMPEMDGYHASMEIRRLEKGRPGVRIIAMTAHAMEDDRAKCLAAGMDDYLPKPVQLMELGTTLKLWIDKNPPAKRPQKLPIDHSRLNSMSRGNKAGMKKLSNLYLHETANQLRLMEAALNKKQMPELRRLAHSCLGASSALGITAILTPLKKLEEAKTSQTSHAARLIDEAQSAFRRVVSYLKPHA